ncbi:MAG: stage III sporulation protein AD [Lachnospiraceae bacterium]|nr:stage III sporulation protein AD [Lachnospiraceae bacterium]
MEAIALMGVLAALGISWMKGVKPEFGTVMSIAGTVAVFAIGLSRVGYLMDTIEELKGWLPIKETYLKLMLKMMGISFLAEFAANICKDAGCSAIAGQIELFGKISVLVTGMPVVLALFETLNGWM